MLAYAVLLCTPAIAQDPTLERAKEAMRERLASTPNYTCVLEIDRSVYPGAATGRFRSKELARLEVSVVGGRENFAWPGESTTQELLEKLLGPGLSSTGEFSAHGRSTFLDPRSRIERLPEDRQKEAGQVGYSYRVPLEASRYVVAGGEKGARSEYEGEFWVERESGQLVRFDVRVPQAPETSGVRRIASFVLYEQRQVSGRAVWLPSEAQIVVESAAGRSFRNDLRFLDCRAFQAEATIRFDDADAGASEDSGPVRHADAPAGLELAMELGTGFDSESARAGDPFEAQLLRAAPEKGEAVLPKGARVSGRVRRLAVIDGGTGRGARRVTTFTLELLDVRWPGYCAPVSATLVMVDKIPRMAPVNPDGLQLPKAFFNSDRALGFRTAARLSATGEGTFVVLGEKYTIPPGARMRWRTEAQPEGACALR
ncbi:MAG: hypothetical protein H6509_03765 [Bryobacterales bacterium]|nr:hypothetical protein [Bryobacterales bacterium]